MALPYVRAIHGTRRTSFSWVTRRWISFPFECMCWRLCRWWVVSADLCRQLADREPHRAKYSLEPSLCWQLICYALERLNHGARGGKPQLHLLKLFHRLILCFSPGKSLSQMFLCFDILTVHTHLKASLFFSLAFSLYFWQWQITNT